MLELRSPAQLRAAFAIVQELQPQLSEHQSLKLLNNLISSLVAPHLKGGARIR